MSLLLRVLLGVDDEPRAGDWIVAAWVVVLLAALAVLVGLAVYGSGFA